MKWQRLSMLLILLLLPRGALAQVPLWAPEGVAVCIGCSPDLSRIVPDGSGGAFLAWREGRDILATQDDVYLQRLTPSGQIAPGWPPGGVPVCTAPASQDLTGLAADSTGGALLVWQDFREGEVDIYCQRILGDGSTAPGWTVNGVAACRWPGFQGSASAIAPDGTGGAYVVWEDSRANPLDEFRDVFAQHLTADGQIAPGWIEGGLPIAIAPEYENIISSVPEAIVPDGQGGVVIVWHQCVAGLCDSFAQRVLANGSTAPGWPNGGLRLFSESGRRDPRIVADGTGGFFLSVATQGDPGFEDDLFVARLNLDGTFFSGWPAGGVQVCCTGLGRAGLASLASDGVGGGLLVRIDSTPQGLDVFAFRVNPAGDLPPGWPFDGILVNDPASPTNSFPRVVGDGAGGAFYTWEWDPPDAAGRARVQHLSSLGTPKPPWPAGGIPATSTRSQFSPEIAPDRTGGVIVAWEEAGGTGSRLGLFAQRFVDDEETQTRPSLVSAEAEEGLVTLVWYAEGAGGLGATVERRTQVSDWRLLGEASADGPDGLRYEDRSVLGGERYAYRLGYGDGDVILYTDETWVDVPSGLRFALDGFHPNPSRGRAAISLALPDASPATLEILDLRGRRIWADEVGSLGAGRHRVEAGSLELAPGVYWIRLSRGAETLTARGIALP